MDINTDGDLVLFAGNLGLNDGKDQTSRHHDLQEHKDKDSRVYHRKWDHGLGNLTKFWHKSS